jgi:ribosomal protein L24E
MVKRSMPQSSDFSLQDLYAALDQQREARGLSWPQVMEEMQKMHQGPRRISTSRRRLSQSTVTGIRFRRAAEGDGVLVMLRWLNRTPESFVPGHHKSNDLGARLPDIPAGKVLRFDARKLHAAVDARRIERKMTWTEVAKEIGFGPTSLPRLSKGKRVVFPGVMRIFRWLDRPAADFTRASDI